MLRQSVAIRTCNLTRWIAAALPPAICLRSLPGDKPPHEQLIKRAQCHECSLFASKVHATAEIDLLPEEEVMSP